MGKGEGAEGRGGEGAQACSWMPPPPATATNIQPLPTHALLSAHPTVTATTSSACPACLPPQVRTGRDLPEAMMMMIPEAWQNDKLMPLVRRRAALAAALCSPPCPALHLAPP